MRGQQPVAAARSGIGRAAAARLQKVQSSRSGRLRPRQSRRHGCACSPPSELQGRSCDSASILLWQHNQLCARREDTFDMDILTPESLCSRAHVANVSAQWFSDVVGLAPAAAAAALAAAEVPRPAALLATLQRAGRHLALCADRSSDRQHFRNSPSSAAPFQQLSILQPLPAPGQQLLGVCPQVIYCGDAPARHAGLRLAHHRVCCRAGWCWRRRGTCRWRCLH